MGRYIWLRKRPEKIIKRSPWNDNIRLGNMKNTTVLTSSKLFRELILGNLDPSNCPLLRQEDYVFFDSVSDIIEDGEIFFDTMIITLRTLLLPRNILLLNNLIL